MIIVTFDAPKWPCQDDERHYRSFASLTTNRRTRGLKHTLHSQFKVRNISHLKPATFDGCHIIRVDDISSDPGSGCILQLLHHHVSLDSCRFNCLDDDQDSRSRNFVSPLAMRVFAAMPRFSSAIWGVKQRAFAQAHTRACGPPPSRRTPWLSARAAIPVGRRGQFVCEPTEQPRK